MAEIIVRCPIGSSRDGIVEVVHILATPPTEGVMWVLRPFRGWVLIDELIAQLADG